MRLTRQSLRTGAARGGCAPESVTLTRRSHASGQCQPIVRAARGAYAAAYVSVSSSLAASILLDRTREPYPDSDKTAYEELVMAWIVLVVSGVLEAVWAVALGKSEGFSRLGPSLVFLTALGLSMAGLAHAMRSVPVGTAYAVWVGIGATLTVAFGMATGEESVSAIKVLLILGLVGCVIGLKLAH